MRSYVSTFITGSESLIPDLLKNHIDDVVIHHVSDGLIHFSSARSYQTIRSLPFVTNTFICLGSTTSQSRQEDVDPVKIIKRLSQQAEYSVLQTTISRNNERLFRVRVSQHGDLISIPKVIAQRITSDIATRTPYTNDPLKSDLEFWFLIRKDTHAYYAVKEVQAHKKREKGVLASDLAYILCSLTSPDRTNVVFDPFAGSGVIPFTYVRHFSADQVIASDYDQVNVSKMKKTEAKMREQVTVQNWDALHLGELADKSVDCIVSDPPWGIYQKKDINIKKFYTMMMDELIRILSGNGCIVLLTSQKELLIEVLHGYEHEVTITQRYDILVSGKKAGIFVLHRIINS